MNGRKPLVSRRIRFTGAHYIGVEALVLDAWGDGPAYRAAIEIQTVPASWPPDLLGTVLVVDLASTSERAVIVPFHSEAPEAFPYDLGAGLCAHCQLPMLKPPAIRVCSVLSARSTGIDTDLPCESWQQVRDRSVPGGPSGPDSP